MAVIVGWVKTEWGLWIAVHQSVASLKRQIDKLDSKQISMIKWILCFRSERYVKMRKRWFDFFLHVLLIERIHWKTFLEAWLRHQWLSICDIVSVFRICHRLSADPHYVSYRCSGTFRSTYPVQSLWGFVSRLWLLF